MKPITLNRLKEVLNYNSQSGILTWNINIGYKIKAGNVAGGLALDGYLKVKIDGYQYYAHVLIWFGMTGEWPEDQIDHENRIRSDNRWSNLRPATHAENQQNKEAPITNTSGYKGVHWHKNKKKWVASIRVNGRKTHIGMYDTAKEAGEAYDFAAKVYHGKFSV